MTKSKNRKFAELARSSKLSELKDANIPAGLTISTYGASLIDDAHSTAARTTLGSVIGTDVQAHSSVLDSTTAAFTTALNTKLSGIETSATADQTAAEIRTLVEAGTDSNVFTDADHTKLNGIAASADVTSITVSDGTNSTARTAGSTITFSGTSNETTVAESSGTITIGLPDDVTVNNLVVGGTVDGRDIATDGTKLDGIATGATNVTNTNQLTNGAGFITSADGGNAATLDSIDSASFLRSDTSDSFTGDTLSYTGSVDEKIILSGSSNPYIRFREGSDNKAYIQWHSSSGTLFIRNQDDGSGIRVHDSLEFTPDGTNFYNIWHANNDGSGSGLDADTLDGNHASAFLTAHPNISAASSSNNSGSTFIQDITLDSNGHVTGIATATASSGGGGAAYVDVATGSYGTVKVDDDRGVNWAGYAIRDDWVFMSNDATAAGIYNDTDNEWGILCRQNSEVELYHNGSVKMETASGGVTITGTATASTFSGSASVDAPVVVASTELRTDRIEGYSSSADAIIFTGNAIAFSPNGSTKMVLGDDGSLQIGVMTGGTQGILNIDNNVSPGKYINFTENGSSNFRGAIGEFADDLFIASRFTGFRFDWATTHIVASSNSGGGVDDADSLGNGSIRWKNIYATNSTIQTSDEREKQQIASLTSAEITAATAISKLFKTYKWNSTVLSEGENARIHSGVVSQQVQTAMAEAGLNASRYAFWCEDISWHVLNEDGTVDEQYETEEEAPEGAVKNERMGIRYPELLAFIGAATEQRLSNIETRLTTLEG